MLPVAVPEIQRTSLSNVVLVLKAMGINDLLHLAVLRLLMVPTWC